MDRLARVVCEAVSGAGGRGCVGREEGRAPEQCFLQLACSRRALCTNYALGQEFLEL